MNVKIGESWNTFLQNEFEKDYFKGIVRFLEDAKKQGKVIYPPEKLVFSAFNQVPLEKVKVVILGQDPYHGHGQAHGLSFSVPYGHKIPPSLRNVYKELETDVEGFVRPTHGNLTTWSSQGVFLLNAFLTVEQKKAKSHQKIGWEEFTDAVIALISSKCNAVVFMLWGNFAKQKAALIDGTKHLVLEAAHPSPLARNRFLNSRHFSQANAYLRQQAMQPINWHLPLEEMSI